ncbi:MAG: histidinol-phosphate transaminase [Betaproteobacteria bacterium AqS2]|uniref:Histidinol-phosphate aminotransferase n=1 Tax=Candidatus Amphirhobacter heronislandensis TaxID=1732024 RepID=A0A930UE42_9GAMM|nr:histidinol-phosphate transaminase [Betaproteobacteria bacterium AqS2]
MAVDRHVPPSVLKLQPYQAGKTVEQIGREIGVEVTVKLSSNENPLGSSPAALRALAAPQDYAPHLYPDAAAVALRAAIAKKLNLEPEQVICGNGSNDILEMAATLTLRPGSKAVYAQHSFVVYRLATFARGAEAIEVPAANFGHDLDAMAEACQQDGVRIVYVANPNNPTGSWHEPEAVAAFVAKIPEDVLVVLDEAYHEYVEDGPGPTLALLAKHPNLLISRTFSKIHGLAGLRIGYGLAQPGLLALLNRVRQPFNANSAAQAAAAAALADDDFIARSKDANRAGMTQLQEGLAAKGYPTIPSCGNFICFASGDGAAMFMTLLRGGVVIRNIDEYGLANWLRATVGTEENNAQLLAALPART